MYRKLSSLHFISFALTRVSFLAGGLGTHVAKEPHKGETCRGGVNRYPIPRRIKYEKEKKPSKKNARTVASPLLFPILPAFHKAYTRPPSLSAGPSSVAAVCMLVALCAGESGEGSVTGN